MLRQFQEDCNSSHCCGRFPGCPIGRPFASGLQARLTARAAVAEPDGLPTAAPVLRERRRSRGRG
jgi:hypothetical protein